MVRKSRLEDRTYTQPAYWEYDPKTGRVNRVPEKAVTYQVPVDYYEEEEYDAVVETGETYPTFYRKVIPYTVTVSYSTQVPYTVEVEGNPPGDLRRAGGVHRPSTRPVNRPQTGSAGEATPSPPRTPNPASPQPKTPPAPTLHRGPGPLANHI